MLQGGIGVMAFTLYLKHGHMYKAAFSSGAVIRVELRTVGGPVNDSLGSGSWAKRYRFS